MSRRIRLIINPYSGGKAKQDMIFSILQEFDINFDVVYTRSAGDATRLSKEAVEQGFEIIVAVGGDGTVNEVVNGIFGSEAVLGVIPTGTGDDFAMSLGITGIKQACYTIAHGRIRKIDTGRVNNDKYFVLGVGIGLDGEVAKRVNTKSLLGVFSYLYTALLTVFQFKPPVVRVELLNKVIEDRVILVTVGNGKRFGGMFYLTPDAILDDGMFDICIIKATGRLRTFINLPKVLKGKHTTLPEVKLIRANKVKITSDTLLVSHVDGELMESYVYDIELYPKSLNVLSP